MRGALARESRRELEHQLDDLPPFREQGRARKPLQPADHGEAKQHPHKCTTALRRTTHAPFGAFGVLSSSRGAHGSQYYVPSLSHWSN